MQFISRTVLDNGFKMPAKVGQEHLYRRILWLKCSGALVEMSSHPGYYSSLKNLKMNYPTNNFH